MTVDDACFHAACFTCDVCQSQIAGGFIKGEDGRRTCESCEPKKCCCACSAQIAGEVVNANGNSYHRDCFKCEKCSSPLDKYFMSEDMTLCELCIKSAQNGRSSSDVVTAGGCKVEPSRVCEACGKEIVGTAIKAEEGKRYHSECFKCSRCSEHISSGFFRDGSGHLLCSPCNVVNRGNAGSSLSREAKRVCVRCKKPIDGNCSIGHLDDTFHEECFVCYECGGKLDSFMIDPNRQFKYQEARYSCTTCGSHRKAQGDRLSAQAQGTEAQGTEAKTGGLDPGSWGSEIPKPEDSSGKTRKPCCICGGLDVENDEAVQLVDGEVIHWACFKCSVCGVGDKPADMKLFRNKVGAVKKGVYVCDKCTQDKQNSRPAAPAPLDLKSPTYSLTFGPYFGSGQRIDGVTVRYMVRLMHGGRGQIHCILEEAANRSLAWKVEGVYTEIAQDGGGGVSTVAFVMESCPEGKYPHGVGHTTELVLEKGATHKALVCEGVTCSLQVGVPDYELALMMRLPELAPTPAPAASPENVWASTANIFALEQLQGDAWKTLKVDPSKREQYLSEEVFAKLFGVSKLEFEKLPKWKRDAQKKEHNLF